MAVSSYWIFPARALLLLWVVLQIRSWNSCAFAGLSLPEPGSISGAPLSSNGSENSAGMVPLTCQSFQCSGVRCYQDEVHGNNTESCHNASYCELYRLNSTSYTAGCSSDCGSANTTEMCMSNGSLGLGLGLCSVECCSAPTCLRLNATAYGDLPLTTTPPPTTTSTTTSTTTTKAPPKNGKVCSSFTCHGEGCYKGRKSSTSCIVGFNFCEMKKTGPHFVAGCSKVCKTAGPPCAAGSIAPCYQECCPAVPKTSCLKLDGKVHFNGAAYVALALPVLQVLACAVVLGLTY